VAHDLDRKVLLTDMDAVRAHCLREIGVVVHDE